jgi:hypothetical protein
MGDGEVIYVKPVAATQALSLVYTYCWAARSGQASDTSAAIGTTVSDGVPDFLLPNLAVIKTVTANIQAADQWSAIFAMYEPQLPVWVFQRDEGD